MFFTIHTYFLQIWKTITGTWNFRNIGHTCIQAYFDTEVKMTNLFMLFMVHSAASTLCMPYWSRIFPHRIGCPKENSALWRIENKAPIIKSPVTKPTLFWLSSMFSSRPAYEVHSVLTISKAAKISFLISRAHLPNS